MQSGPVRSVIPFTPGSRRAPGRLEIRAVQKLDDRRPAVGATGVRAVALVRMERISKRSSLTLVLTAVLLIGLETLAYLKGGPFLWVAARLWALMGLGFLVLAILEIARSVAGAVRERSMVSLVMVLLVGLTTLWGIGGVDHVQLQHEAPQEVTRGLNALGTPSWSYTEARHLGYPDRQYLIVAVPSLVFGRGLLALRLGFALAFFLGVLLFWSGSRALWEEYPRGHEAAALAALAVVAFPYAVKHLHWYEQTTLPLAFTLAATGWLMITLSRPSVVNWLGVAWIGALLGTSYTPALGSWGLLLVVLLWLSGRAWRNGEPSTGLNLLVVAIVVTGFGALSFLTRTDLVREHGDVVRPDPIESIIEAFSIFFLSSPTAFFPVVLILPMLTILVLGLVGRLGLPGLAVSWWTVGIVVTGIGFAGYAVSGPDFAMHRAQVVIPPLLLLAGWPILHLKAARSTTRLARFGFVAVGLVVIGQTLWTVMESYRRYRPMLRELVYSELLDRAARCGLEGGDPVVVLILSQRNEFLNSGDFLRYFFPGHITVRTLERFSTLESEADLVFLIAGPEVDPNQVPAVIDPASTTTIAIDNPYDPHEVLIWTGNLSGI